MKLIFLLIMGKILSQCSGPNTNLSNNADKENTSIQAMESNKTEEEAEKVTELNFDKDYLLGKFEPSKHPDFEKIPKEMTNKENIYLRKDALEAFTKMKKAAEEDGINLIIVSATRNFQAQKEIWEAKWNGSTLVEGENLAITIKDPEQKALKILRYSSMPGTSRHHWGTDIDLNDLNDNYFLTGKGKKEYEWLVNNAGKFGFCQVYSSKNENRQFGYEEEKWHWSYTPISKILLKQYLEKVKQEDICGFLGAETAPKVDVINKYVAGINPDCK